MNDTEQQSRLQSSPYIISPFPPSTLSSLFLSAGPEPAPIPTTVPFSLSWSHLSSCSSLCQSLSRFHPSLISPSPLPPSNGFRWANFISVMPLVCNSQFGFSGKWPPLFIEGLFIWTTWLLCPNPEITFECLWKGWCVVWYGAAGLTPPSSGNYFVWLKPGLRTLIMKMPLADMQLMLILGHISKKFEQPVKSWLMLNQWESNEHERYLFSTLLAENNSYCMCGI